MFRTMGFWSSHTLKAHGLGTSFADDDATQWTSLSTSIRFRTLTVITIKGVSALISSQLGFSATAEIDDLEASILNRQSKEQIIPASQPRLVPKDLFKQPQDVPVPQAELREPAISIRAAIIAYFQLSKIDFLE